jgi:hypothetical protein
VRDLGHKRIVGVGIRQHRADGKENCTCVSGTGDKRKPGSDKKETHTLADSKGRTPLVTEDV